MIPTNYFDRADTPTRSSPIGRIMRQLDALYPEMLPSELRALANERIHSNGPGKVKWSKDERRRLQDAGVLLRSKEAERFLALG